MMFFLGFSGVGRCSICFLYLMEMLPASKQTIIGTLLQMNNGMIPIWMSLYFWFISKNWVWIEVFASALTLVCIMGAMMLPESPKFLLSKQQWGAARGAITHIARFNGYGPFTGKFDREKISQKAMQNGFGLKVGALNNSYVSTNEIEVTEDPNNVMKSPISRVKEEQQLKGTLKDLVKIRRHLINLLLMVYIWIASSFDMYLITFQLKYLPGSIFVNSLVSSTVDIPISILGGVLYHRYGVRITLPIAYAMSLIGSIALLILGNKVEALVPIMVMLARGGVKVALDLCYLANSTIFPAIFAGTAFGMCNIGAKGFTILSPLIAEVGAPVPMIIFSIVLAFAIVAAMGIKPEAGAKH
jgi:Sugar (and other) transporter